MPVTFTYTLTNGTTANADHVQDSLNKLRDAINSFDGSAITDETVTSEKLKSTIAFSVTGTTTWTGAEQDAGTGSESFDVGNDLSAGVFVAPITGIYQFNALVQYNNAGDGQYVRGILHKNGVAEVECRAYTGVAAAYPSTSMQPTMQLSAGDQIKLRVQHSEGVSRDVGWRWGGFLVGQT